MRRLNAPTATWIHGILGILGIAVALGTTGCVSRRSSDPAESTGEMPDQEVTDFAITETEEGHLEWKLFARYAATYSVRSLVAARAIRVDFFGDDGARTSTLTANTGEINQRTRDMVARGRVVLETTEGTRLSSEELRFLNRDQRIVVPETQLVRVQRGGDVLTGYGFESDPELRHYEFKRRVQAVVRTRTGGLIESGDGE
jgi:LPS export ABC transporter protein LptC